MNGCILHGMPVAVDCFQQRILSKVKLFFLTHMHSDHTVGLSSSWRSIIYCSHMTGRLLRHKFNILPQFIQVLEENQPYILGDNDFKVTVKLLPANHCPGSSMFLFESDSCRILYTGDFRFDQGIPQTFVDMNTSVDLLYLDNTYCEPSCHFPSRSEVKQLVKCLCKKHPSHRIFIGTSWIGHEDLLVFIASELKEFMFVDSAKLEVLKLLELPDVFKEGRSSRLNAIPYNQLNRKVIKSMNLEMPTIGIRPTAMFGGSTKNIGGLDCPLYIVPYSNHSNFSELSDFVRVIRPGFVKPVIPGRKQGNGMESSFRANMHQFDDFLSGSSRVMQSIKENCHANRIYFSGIPKRKISPHQMRKKKAKILSKLKSSSNKRGVVFDDQLQEANIDSISGKCSHKKNGSDGHFIIQSKAVSTLIQKPNQPDEINVSKMHDDRKQQNLVTDKITEKIENEILADVCTFFK